MNYIRMRNFLHQKVQFMEMTRKSTELEKIFVILKLIHKGFVSGIWKQLPQINKEKTGILIDNGQKTELALHRKSYPNYQ